MQNRLYAVLLYRGEPAQASELRSHVHAGQEANITCYIVKTMRKTAVKTYIYIYEPVTKGAPA